jgi:hypothetical protein
MCCYIYNFNTSIFAYIRLLSDTSEAGIAVGTLLYVTETIFPRIYARTYYAHPRARVMSFSNL